MSLADAVSVGLLECRGGRIAWANARLASWLAMEEATDLLGRGADTLVRDLGEGLPDWLAGEAPSLAATEGSSGLPPGLPSQWPADVPAQGAVGVPTQRSPGVPTQRTAGVLCERTAGVLCVLEGRGPQRRVRVRPLGSGVWEFEDVTGRSGLKGEVHRLGSDLLSARRSIDALRARLERESKNRDELLSVVSHELQTPLTVVAGFTRLLLSEKVGPLNPEQRHFLSEITKSCRRLSRFISSLMDAQGESDGGRPVELAEGSLRSTIVGVVDMLRPLVQERRQQIRLELEEQADRAHFDPMRVEQILINLLSNALKYGCTGGEIVVSTRSVQAAGRLFAEVAVSDDGPGVPEVDRQRIFEPYVRAGAREGGADTSGDGEGLGLGLAICRRIVDAHGGALGVTASPSGGARFWFTLSAPTAGAPGCDGGSST